MSAAPAGRRTALLRSAAVPGQGVLQRRLLKGRMVRKQPSGAVAICAEPARSLIAETLAGSSTLFPRSWNAVQRSGEPGGRASWNAVQRSGEPGGRAPWNAVQGVR